MDPINLIIVLSLWCLIAYLAYLVITKFFPEPIKMVALCVVGVILLIVLLTYATGGGAINTPTFRIR